MNLMRCWAEVSRTKFMMFTDIFHQSFRYSSSIFVSLLHYVWLASDFFMKLVHGSLGHLDNSSQHFHFLGFLILNEYYLPLPLCTVNCFLFVTSYGKWTLNLCCLHDILGNNIDIVPIFCSFIYVLEIWGLVMY